MRNFVITAIIFSVFVLAAFPSFSQEQASAEGKLAIMTWEETTHNFREIEKGIPATYDFSFKNSGDVPLLITNVKASCGCTATNYPKSAVQPGETAMITATYNAKTSGSFSKTLTVYTNTENSAQVLTIKGTVQ